MIIYFKSKLVSMSHEVDIFDEGGNALYKMQSHFLSIEDKTQIEDVKTNKVICNIHRKPISIHEIYYVDMADGSQFEMSTELLHVVDEAIDIKGLGWKIVGNFLEHDYDIQDGNGTVIASSHKKWVTLHEAYQIDIEDESKLETLVAVFGVLDHIIVTREQNETDPHNV